MNLFEIQQWIEQDQLLSFHLKRKAKGTRKCLEKGRKIQISPEKLVLVETGVLASCYQKRDLIYALTLPHDYLRMSQSGTYIEALQTTYYLEYDLNDVEETLKQDSLFTHLLLSLLYKEEQIRDHHLFYATHSVEEKIQYTFSLFLQKEVRLVEPLETGDMVFPRWFNLTLLARLINASSVSVSKMLPSVAQQMNITTNTKTWRWKRIQDK
ncbi:hypothetical protein [Listeria valentina]|uniref:hypothetical protein n=1 Tax=Listeria valentina TaxID=2705293 RepID=UPI00142FE41C|nr:hypothetical protein [Listeria valentina]